MVKRKREEEGRREERNLNASSTERGFCPLNRAVIKITFEKGGAENRITTNVAQNVFKADLENPELFSLPITLCRIQL